MGAIKSRIRALKQIMNCLLCFYNRMEDMNIMDKVKVDSNDLFIMYYLVKLMEEEDDE